MKKYSEAFVGFDTAKQNHAVAIADVGRDGEVRYFGEIDSPPAAIEKLIGKSAERHATLHVCYEVGPTGYGLYRQVEALGHDGTVVAPSLIPRKPGERIETNRRDAVTLARLFRAGELTSMPSTRRCVTSAGRARQRQRICARNGSSCRRSCFVMVGCSAAASIGAWPISVGSPARSSSTPAQQIVLQDAVDAIADAAARLRRLDEQLLAIVPSWSMAPVVAASQAMRGVSFIVAVTFVAEIGDVRRFDKPRQPMAFLGLVPSARSTGERVRRAGLTLAANRRARRVPVEGAWTSRSPARVSETFAIPARGTAETIRDLAWKAQIRRCARYRRLLATGKKTPGVIAAIAGDGGISPAIGHHVEPVT